VNDAGASASVGARGFRTQIGEAFVGQGAEAAHVNTVLGGYGSAVETAWVSALAQPSAGHTPFVTVLQPGLPVKPLTLFVNKAAIANDRHASLTWGAAQAGVAKGVADAVADGTVPAADADDRLLVAAVWVDPEAVDAALVFENNAASTLGALQAGARNAPTVDAVLAARDAPWNPYFRPRA
jgi:5,6,7,8-tetrahydromethanopterin hydro-lyase